MRRIRQLKPDFWSDPDVAALPDSAKLTYMALWQVSDDAGFVETMDPAQLGAFMRPYDGRKWRERQLGRDIGLLVERGFVELCQSCGQGVIPTLAKHQKTGGRPVYTARDAHARVCAPLRAFARPGRKEVGKEKGSGLCEQTHNPNETSNLRDELAARNLEVPV